MNSIDYVLTTFSPAMFGERARANIRIISKEEATDLVGPETRIVATRVSHDQLARQLFPAAGQSARYAMLKPGVQAVQVHYRGPQVPDSGELPTGGMVTFYLVEVDEYQEGDA